MRRSLTVTGTQTIVMLAMSDGKTARYVGRPPGWIGHLSAERYFLEKVQAGYELNRAIRACGPR
jgi:hypothetical protein